MEKTVPGLQVYPDFIDPAMEEKLIKEIDAQPWIVDYDRRLQYFGYRNELEAPYDLVGFPVPFPPIIQELAVNIKHSNLLLHQPDQVIINEYLPGQGIRPHKDRNYFENQICGVNLGSGCIMKFIKTAGGEVVDVEIPRRSLYIMQDEARTKWTHSIPPRKKDNINGTLQLRERRLSITYRKVKMNKVKPINPNGKAAAMLKDIFKMEI